MASSSGMKIMEVLKAGEKIIYNRARNAIDEAEESAFIEGIEIGIVNTIASLYEANVEDEEIIRVMTKCWGINKEEAENRLLSEKIEAPVRALKEHLRLKGYSNSEIDDFIKSHQVKIKVRHEKELWELRRKPDKLLKILRNK